jgi:hypothetical protein
VKIDLLLCGKRSIEDCKILSVWFSSDALRNGYRASTVVDALRYRSLVLNLVLYTGAEGNIRLGDWGKFRIYRKQDLAKAGVYLRGFSGQWCNIKLLVILNFSVHNRDLLVAPVFWDWHEQLLPELLVCSNS